MAVAGNVRKRQHSRKSRPSGMHIAVLNHDAYRDTHVLMGGREGHVGAH